MHKLVTTDDDKTKFQFKRVCFPGVRGLATSLHVVYDFTTSGHTVEYICSVYTVYIHSDTIYAHFYAIYLLISNAIKM